MNKLILLICLAILSACNSESIAPTTTLPEQLRILAPAPSFWKNPDSDSLAGTMEASCLVTQNLIGSGKNFLYFNTHAYFNSAIENYAQPHEVWLNGLPINQPRSRNHPQDTVTFGIMHHWQVKSSWSRSSPTIDDSVLAPKLIHILSPSRANDTISKSNGFTLIYEDPGTDSVEFGVSYDSALAETADPWRPHREPNVRLRFSAPATGSYIVTASSLASFPNDGCVQMYVSAVRRKKIVVGGRSYGLTVQCTARTFCFLKN